MTDRKTESSELDWRSKEEREVYELTGYRLTHRQRAFAERFAEGNCTATQAAIDAGYAPSSAASLPGQLLNPNYYPAVVAYLAQLRENMAAKYGVTKEGMLQRLHTLSRGAEDSKQYSAAINAEKIRASLAGLTIDRRETVNTVDGLSKDQVIERLEDLKRKHPAAFDIIEGEYTEPEPIPDAQLVEYTPEK